MATRSISNVARRVKAEDRKMRDSIAKQRERSAAGLAKAVRKVPGFAPTQNNGHNTTTMDSFVNFAQRMGVGADNALTSASYSFNPISRNRVLLEWMHRGSWLAGAMVDYYADDMTRAGIKIKGETKPEDIAKIQERMNTLMIWNKVNETAKWARLYGGCLGVMMVDGQNLSTPLRLETIGKDQFKGLLVLDKWMVDPSINDLITTMGPDIGLPKFYTITADSPALPRAKVHHSRCLRMDGVTMPYWERVQENLWGISVLERFYDRMIGYDGAYTGAAQLVYKAYIRTYKIKGLRDLAAAGGPGLLAIMAQLEVMRRFQGQEGVTLMDAEDEFEGKEQNSFQGLDATLSQFAQQLSGASGIPLMRLFGQSPTGFNSGDNEMRMYYDSIKQQQTKQLLNPVTAIVRAVAASVGVRLPEGTEIEFNPLWQLQEKEKAEIAEIDGRTVQSAYESNLISQKGALVELRQSSHVTGRFTNITDEDINAADDSIEPPTPEGVDPLTGLPLPPAPGDEPSADPAARGAVRDSIAAAAALKLRHDLNVVFENTRDSVRQGHDFRLHMPYDYGYFAGTTSTDGEGVDLIMGPHLDCDNFWLVDQIQLGSKAYDEPKVIGGYLTLGEAMRDWNAGHTDGRGPERIGNIKPMTVDGLKEWLLTMKSIAEA